MMRILGHAFRTRCWGVVQGGAQAKGSAAKEAGCDGRQAKGSAMGNVYAKEGASQGFLETGGRPEPQDAMRQPSMPSLLVDHRVAVGPGLRVVRQRHGLPPPRVRLQNMKDAAGTALASW